MRILIALIAVSAFAQTAAPLKTYTSAKEVASLAAQAKAERTNQANVMKNLITAAPYTVQMEYRATAGPAATHPTEAEFFYVIEGSGAITTGGKLVANAGVNTIEGGTEQAISKGDFICVPEGTPHMISKSNGSLVLASIKAPRPLPAAK